MRSRKFVLVFDVELARWEGIAALLNLAGSLSIPRLVMLDNNNVQEADGGKDEQSNYYTIDDGSPKTAGKSNKDGKESRRWERLTE
jgi:hypothetical protein